MQSCMHTILWYIAIIAFSPKFAAYTIKLGRSQVLDILCHLGLDPQTLRWIDATADNEFLRLLFCIPHETKTRHSTVAHNFANLFTNFYRASACTACRARYCYGKSVHCSVCPVSVLCLSDWTHSCTREKHHHSQLSHILTNISKQHIFNYLSEINIFNKL